MAVGKPITPVVAELVPTLIVKAAVPLFEAIEAPLPKPDEIVGAALETHRLVSVSVVNLPVLGVVLPIAPGEAKVAPFSELAFRLATLVVEVTTSGAVPVETVEVS